MSNCSQVATGANRIASMSTPVDEVVMLRVLLSMGLRSKA
jgi:hypothetical protein